MNRQENESFGYLTVRVSTARGAIPLENATVSIKSSSAEYSGILYSFESNEDGLTPRVALPAPDRAASLSPDASGKGENESSAPYSLWSIDVFREGFLPAKYINVAVYSGVTSVQSAELIPIPENFIPFERYNESSAPNL